MQRDNRIKSFTEIFFDRIESVIQSSYFVLKKYLVLATLVFFVWFMNFSKISFAESFKDICSSIVYTSYTTIVTVMNNIHTSASESLSSISRYFTFKEDRDNLCDIELLKKYKILEDKNKSISEENSILKSQLSFVDNAKYTYITTRIFQITNFQNRKSVVIPVGAKNGVKVGNIVINKYGIVGRIAKTLPEFSIITLLGEDSVRLAAITVPSNQKCIITSNSKNTNYQNNGTEIFLSMSYLDNFGQVSGGDVVVTSGDDGITPYGIKIGYVKKSRDNSIRAYLRQNFFESLFVQVILENIPNIDSNF